MIPYFEKSLFIHNKTDMAILDLSFFEQDIGLWKDLIKKVMDTSNREPLFTNFLGGRLGDNKSVILRVFDVVGQKKAISSPKLLKAEDLENQQQVLTFPTGGIVVCDVSSIEKVMPKAEIPEENVFSNLYGYVTLSNDVTRGPFIHINRQASVLPALMITSPAFFTEES